ncbi:uncharacterized protein LOC134404990 [Elgaria multicarinata webbii]|uniref:uncharacterized protein LOC134404990 n=1 Tax=Elgaria multicarinata webbii TaxID=159646 RepID=UPI002FCD6B9C
MSGYASPAIHGAGAHECVWGQFALSLRGQKSWAAPRLRLRGREPSPVSAEVRPTEFSGVASQPQPRRHPRLRFQGLRAPEKQAGVALLRRQAALRGSGRGQPSARHVASSWPPLPGVATCFCPGGSPRSAARWRRLRRRTPSPCAAPGWKCPPPARSPPGWPALPAATWKRSYAKRKWIRSGATASCRPGRHLACRAGVQGRGKSRSGLSGWRLGPGHGAALPSSFPPGSLPVLPLCPRRCSDQLCTGRGERETPSFCFCSSRLFCSAMCWPWGLGGAGSVGPGHPPWLGATPMLAPQMRTVSRVRGYPFLQQNGACSQADVFSTSSCALENTHSATRKMAQGPTRTCCQLMHIGASKCNRWDLSW